MQSEQFQDGRQAAVDGRDAIGDLGDLRRMLAARLGPLAVNARLTTEIPLVEGEIRLTLVGGPVRITAWGCDMVSAIAALISRMNGAEKGSEGDSPMLPL